MSPTTNGCNPPKNHCGIQEAPTNKWQGKIPLIDLPTPAITGAGVNAGKFDDIGSRQWTALCNEIATLLAKGIEAKRNWILAPAPGQNKPSEVHCLASTTRMYFTTLNYINAINDIPNNAIVTKVFQDDGEEGAVDANNLPAEPEPPAVDLENLYNSVRNIDYNAAFPEPTLDSTADNL